MRRFRRCVSALHHKNTNNSNSDHSLRGGAGVAREGPLLGSSYVLTPDGSVARGRARFQGMSARLAPLESRASVRTAGTGGWSLPAVAAVCAARY